MLRSSTVVRTRAVVKFLLVLFGSSLAYAETASTPARSSEAAAVRVAPAPPPEAASDEWTPADNDALEAHHLRSLGEMTVGLGVGAVAYWLMQNRNVADWDNPTPEERFNGRAWRFDNNSLAVNFIAHPFAGGIAHSMARANHHGVWTAFGYSSLTSFLWEFVLEFKEKVSVNDLIVTSPTGLPIGEFFYKLGLYLDAAADPGVATHAARWVLGTGVTVDRALDGRPRPHVTERDALGLTRRIWHEFDAGAGVRFVESPGVPDYTLVEAGMVARLVTLPGYLEPRVFDVGFSAAEISDFSFTVEGSEHGVGLAMRADTLLAGYHTQSLRLAGGELQGAAATFGVSLAYDYLRSEANDYASRRHVADLPAPDLAYHVPVSAEQYSALQLPGPAVDYRASAPGVEVAVSARAYPSFAGFGAPSFYDWAADNLEERTKHALHRQGYFYGWGGMGTVRGRVRLGPLVLAGHASYASYVSHDGLDRHVERLTVDVPARGELLTYGASVGIRPLDLPVTLSADYDVRSWYADVDGYEARDRRSSGGISTRIEF